VNTRYRPNRGNTPDMLRPEADARAYFYDAGDVSPTIG